MGWVMGLLILGGVGFVLRRILGVHARAPQTFTGLARLQGERQAIYDGFAPEIEARIVMLGISLNDAFEERSADHPDLAWRLIRLSTAEWNSIASICANLFDTLARHVEDTQVLVTPRSIHAHRFRSKPMVDYVRMRGLLDQLVFSSRSLYQLQLRLLRRAAEIVSEEFRRACEQAEKTDNRSAETWSHFDLCYHDFDLISKEALLALRAFLACLPQPALARFSLDLNALIRARVRSRVTQA
jgi:hypothetical protein